MVRRSVCLLLLLFAAAAAVPTCVAGQTASTIDTVRLTLSQTLALAEAAAPRLRELRALADATAADARAVRASRLPTLDLRAGYARWSDVDPFTIALPGQAPRTLFPNLPDNWTGRASLVLPLWTGGRLGAAVRTAARQQEAAAHDADAGAAGLAMETIAAYWDLAVAREREQVLAGAIAAYEAHAADARNRQRVGMAATNEVLAVEVERDRAELARLRATGDAELAQADLARLLDLPAGQAIAVADPLPAPEGAPEELESLVAAALATRPERAAVAARQAAAEAAVGVARAGRLPQIALTAGYDHSDPNRRLVPPRDGFADTWDAGVSVSLNVFDGGRVGAETAAARARAVAARQRAIDLERRVRLEVTARRIEFVTARAAATVAEHGLAAARESRRRAADRYREGLISSAELLDAETALLRAQLDRAETLVGVRLAAAALDRAVGRQPGR